MTINRFHFRADFLFIPAALFMVTNTLGLVLIEDSAPRWSVLIYLALWLMLWFVGQYVLKSYRPGHDPYIFPIIMLLVGWGLLQVDRLAPDFALRHAVWCTLGIIVLLGISAWPGKLLWLGWYPYTIMFGGLLLVGATFLFGTAPLGFGPRLWLKFPFVNIFFQPSELLKLLFVVFAAGFFSLRYREASFGQKQPSILNIAWLGPLAAMWLFSMSLLVLQQDLGAATLLFFSFIALVYLSTGERIYVIGGIGLLIIAGFIATNLYDRVALRMEALVNPWPDASDRAFQIVQALYAIGAGGVMGSGVGQGFPIYIPVVHSDFALAAIAEEWGMLGTFVVICCFAVLLWRGFKIALLVNHPFYRFLSAGITILLGTQAIMIIGGVAKLLPLTGVTLPFVSYGGSSLVISSIMIGLLLWISAQLSDGSQNVVQVTTRLSHRLKRMNFTFLIGLAGLMIGIFWWGGVQSAWLAEREDNPRSVEAELRIQRGTIYDRNGVVLAENQGTVDRQQRIMVEAAAASAIGYSNLRFGNSAIEEGLDFELRGETSDSSILLARNLLHRPQVGRDIRLTLDASLQAESVGLMGNKSGAALLLTLKDGAIRSLVSTPSFDPNQLEDSFDQLLEDESAPLINRALQSNYQPGKILLPFFLSWRIEQEGQLLSSTDSIDALQDEQLRLLFGEWDLLELLEFWDRYQFDSIADSVPIVQIEPASPESINILNAIEGEEELLVTPIQVARAMTIFSNEGMIVQPQIISGIREGEVWEAWDAAGSIDRLGEEPILSADSAEAALKLLPSTGRVASYVVEVDAGPEQTNAWFIGFAPPENPRYGLVIVQENVDSVEKLQEKGIELLLQALES